MYKMSDNARFHSTGRWLLSHEAQGSDSAAGLAGAGAGVLNKLEQSLAVLIGRRGARLLLTRALQAARARHAFLQTVQIDPQAGGLLTGLPESVAGLDPPEVCDGLVAVIAEALALLSDFVGVGLALRQVRRAWPELPRGEAPVDEEADGGTV
jgi:hypothetical protein